MINTKIYKRPTALKSKKGNALVLVVMIFAVMSILALALLGVSANEFAISQVDEKHEKAYYIARSATESATQWIQNNLYNSEEFNLVVPPSDIIGESYANHVTFGETNDLYDLKIWRETAGNAAPSPGSPSQYYVMITASAKVDGVEASSQSRMLLSSLGDSVFEYAVFSYELFDLNTGNLNIPNGKAGTNANKPSDDKFNDFAYEDNSESLFNQGIIYDAVDVPQWLVDLSATDPAILPLEDVSGQIKKMTIEESVRFESLDLTNRTMHINNSEDPVYVYVSGNDQGEGSFKYDSTTISIEQSMNNGGSPVYIIVDVQMIAGKNNTNFALLGNSGNPEEEPLLYLIINSSNSDVFFNAGSEIFSAYIYAPFTKVEYRGNTQVTGAIISQMYTNAGSATGLKYIMPSSENIIGSIFDSVIDSYHQQSVHQPEWLR